MKFCKKGFNYPILSCHGSLKKYMLLIITMNGETHILKYFRQQFD